MRRFARMIGVLLAAAAVATGVLAAPTAEAAPAPAHHSAPAHGGVRYIPNDWWW